MDEGGSFFDGTVPVFFTWNSCNSRHKRTD